MSEPSALFRLRVAEPVEALRLRAFYRAAFEPAAARLGYRPSPMDRDLTALLERRMGIVAEADTPSGALLVGAAVTSVQTTARGPALYVDAIATAPASQRCGVGRALMRAVEGLAAELCLPAVELDTDPRLPEPMRFYLRCGYALLEAVARRGYERARFRKPVTTALERLLSPSG